MTDNGHESNPNYVTLDATAYLILGVAASIVSFFRNVPESQRDQETLVQFLETVLEDGLGVPHFSQRDRDDLRWCLKAFRAQLDDPAMKLLEPSEGPPH